MTSGYTMQKGKTHQFYKFCLGGVQPTDLLSKTSNEQALARAKVRGMALGKQSSQLLGVRAGTALELPKEWCKLPGYRDESRVKKMHLCSVGNILVSKLKDEVWT